MKRLFLLVSFLFIFCVVTSMAQTITSATDMIDRGGGNTPIIWKKFLGFTAAAAPAVPTLIDYSYAGYMNGEEEITVTNNTVYNVLDYGAIVSDGNSDTQAIKDVIHAARNGGIIFFPPGQYDIFMGSEDTSMIELGSGGLGGVVLRGSGAQGSGNGGSTIKLHNAVDGPYSALFGTKWFGNGSNSRTAVVGSFPRGSTYFDVANSSSLIGTRFILLQANDLTGSDWDDHCSVSESDMPNRFTDISNGIDITEIAEIDYIVGNRVYVKVPIMTPLNSNYFIAPKNLNVGMGAEDLHFDGGLTRNYVHLQEQTSSSNRSIFLWNMCAESWVRRCRFSNVTGGGTLKGSYASCFIENIFDGRYGHVPMGMNGSTRCFIGLVEDHTNRGMHHGIGVSHHSSGCVVWAVGGPKLRGPDTHGKQSRISLFDNYYGVNHDSSGGAEENLPHHLDGYTRWNNFVTSTNEFDPWSGGGEFDQWLGGGGGEFDLWWGEGGDGLKITQGNVIGHVQAGRRWPKDAYVEHFQSVVSPVSLYLGQLEERLGYIPAWVDNTIEDFRVFRKAVINGNSYLPDTSLEFSRHFTRRILENKPIGTNVGSVVVATNGIIDNTITYSLNSNVSKFEIDENSGQLTSTIIFDYESKDSYTLVVNASDSYGNTARVTLTIRIGDVLEFSNHFTRGIPENKPIGTKVGSVVVASNSIIDNIITYSLDDEVSDFEIDENSGQLTSAIVFDYESKDSYTLVVNASDSYGNTASVTLTIRIGDVYEFSTVTRTQQVQDAIVNAISGVNNVADVTEDHLEAILYLNLNDKGITTLKSDDFQGLTSLQRLVLSNNGLQALPDGIFTGLTSIKRIDLDNNKFRTLPHDIFTGLISLQRIELNNNKLQALPDGIFNGLTSLQHLVLSNNNKLKTLPDGIFNGLTSLKTIGLHHIKLESLSGDVFNGLSSLEQIFLNGNKLENLDGDLFSGLASLTHLQLNNNLLESFPSGIFKGLTSLKYFWLQGNNVDPLPLIVSLEKVGATSVKAVIPTGAPFDIVLPVSVMNGNIVGGATTITISAGETESDEDDLLSVARDNNTTDVVSIEIGVLPSLPDHHQGYKISKSDDLPLQVLDAIVGAPTHVKVPKITVLHRNFPNPFNPETWIPYQLANPSNVNIVIYNSRGIVVRKIDMGMKPSGYYMSKSSAAYWDGRNLFGERVSSGIYFYQFNTDSMSALKKMVILK